MTTTNMKLNLAAMQKDINATVKEAKAGVAGASDEKGAKAVSKYLAALEKYAVQFAKLKGAWEKVGAPYAKANALAKFSSSLYMAKASDEPLTLGYRGQGITAKDQFISLLSNFGLKKAHEICVRRGLYGVKKDGRYLVDTKLSVAGKLVREVSEDGARYYIYVNYSRADLQARLDEFAMPLS